MPEDPQGPPDEPANVPDASGEPDSPAATPPAKRPAKRKVKAKARPKAAAAPMAPPPRRRPPRRSVWDSRLVAGAVFAGCLLIAAVIALVFLDDDDGGGPDQALVTTTTEADVPTTDDLEVPFPTAPSTTTTEVAPGTTPTTASRSTTTIRTNTTTGTGGGPACGSGSVRAEPRGGTATGESTYSIGAAAFSNFSEPVEVTTLVVRVTFADGSSRDVGIDTSGPAIAPGDSREFPRESIASGSPPEALEIVTLTYQPQGKPQCSISG